ncbi:MAG: serine/threonine protein kinase [Planctomycetaceae bacterium]|nr:serine/threonine protein kinase [Planctomycetaceae bacterium]
MLTTTHRDVHLTLTNGGNPAPAEPNELVAQYQEIVADRRLNWTHHLRLLKLLGSGGQGVVYLTHLRGTDQFTLPAALKIFSPERFEDIDSYNEAMLRAGQTAARVAQIQHDNLLYVYNFVDQHRIRMLVMEWIDGYDLARLLVPDMLERIRGRVSNRRWEYVNQVIVTAGPQQPRMKAGVAVAIVRDCLNALAALHRHGIVHGDIKPSNIMLKRTGIAKIVDIGSAFELRDPPRIRSCTLGYAAPEVLENRETTPRSDLCSLGYVLIELLSGRQPFAGLSDMRELMEAKRTLPLKLGEILPDEVLRCELLCGFIRGMIAPDALRRFPSAEAAELLKEGAAAFHRQLVIGNLASEYDNDIRLWLEELKELDAQDDLTSEAA